jgi:hypothetical protein
MADIPPGGSGLTLIAGLTTPHRVLAKGGYRLSGDVDTGYRMTVPYYVRWEHAFAFVDELFGLSTAPVQAGPITYRAPHKIPFVPTPLYCRSFEVEPMGVGDAQAGTNLGLRAGEYFAYAKITAVYTTPEQGQQPGEDEQQQLDPDNPITVCRQSVRASGKMETVKEGHYVWDGDGKKVPGDFAVPSCESMLELEFPLIPYLPWQMIRPYIGKINSVPVLGCGTGELLLEGMSTRVEATTQGFSQNLVLSFAACSPGQTWNHLPRNGVPTLVKRAGSSDRIYQSADFTTIFDALERS